MERHQITGHTELIGLLAYPIRHSQSPATHNAAYEKLGVDIVNLAFEVDAPELEDAINRPLGATTLDGLKRRVRPGSGRCQAGFCTPKMIEILAKNLGCTVDRITKSGGESYILSNVESDKI